MTDCKFMGDPKPDTRREVARLRAQVKALKGVLRQIVNDLPTKRDWLDPDLEAQAKELLK